MATEVLPVNNGLDVKNGDSEDWKKNLNIPEADKRYKTKVWHLQWI